MSEFSYDAYLKEKAVYHTSLGSMFDSFANAERELVYMLGKLSNLNHDMTNALLSGVRADQAVNLTRRVYRALKREIPIEVDSSLSQLKTISTDRNLLAHHGSIYSVAHGMVSSDYRVVLPDKEMREISVSPEQLDYMALDLTGITLVFSYTARNGRPTDEPAYDFTLKDAVEFAKKGSWHYKSEKR